MSQDNNYVRIIRENLNKTISHAFFWGIFWGWILFIGLPWAWQYIKPWVHSLTS